MLRSSCAVWLATRAPSSAHDAARMGYTGTVRSNLQSDLIFSTDLPVSVDYASSAPPGIACGLLHATQQSRDPQAGHPGHRVPLSPNRDRDNYTWAHEAVRLASLDLAIIRIICPPPLPPGWLQRQAAVDETATSTIPGRRIRRGARVAHPNPEHLTWQAGRQAGRKKNRQSDRRPARPVSSEKGRPCLGCPGPGARSLCWRGHERESLSCRCAPPPPLAPLGVFWVPCSTGRICGVFAPRAQDLPRYGSTRDGMEGGVAFQATE